MMRAKCSISSWPIRFAVAAIVLLDIDPGLAQTISFGTPIDVKEKYAAPASDAGGKPRGISGMACLGAAGEEKRHQ
jgi:hypothetical protein